MGIATLYDIIQVLDPFQEVLSHMEEENMVTFFPVIAGLEHSLKSFMDGKSLYCFSLANALMVSVKKRLHPYLDRTDAIAADVMDPRFKLTWIPCKKL